MSITLTLIHCTYSQTILEKVEPGYFPLEPPSLEYLAPEAPVPILITSRSRWGSWLVLCHHASARVCVCVCVHVCEGIWCISFCTVYKYWHNRTLQRTTSSLIYWVGFVLCSACQNWSSVHVPVVWTVKQLLEIFPLFHCCAFRSTTSLELRCVIGVVRHGDRTPKQKMKMVVKHNDFFRLFKDLGGYKKGYLKIKKPKELQVQYRPTGANSLAIAPSHLQKKPNKQSECRMVLKQHTVAYYSLYGRWNYIDHMITTFHFIMTVAEVCHTLKHFLSQLLAGICVCVYLLLSYTGNFCSDDILKCFCANYEN